MNAIEKSLGVHKVVDILVRNGADVNAKDDLGYTPLASAVLNGNLINHLFPTIAQILSEYRVIKYTTFDNPFFLGHKKIVEILVQYGADLNLKNDDGDTPLDIALAKGTFFRF